MTEEENLVTQQNKLEDRLLKLRKEKKISRLVLIAPIFIFLGPFYPGRTGRSLYERMGYSNAVIWMAVFYVIVIPIIWYIRFQEIDNEVFLIECEIDKIKRKRGLI